MVIVCDHANNMFPPSYNSLGLPVDQLERHIAYDIGAAEVTRRLSQIMQAPAVLSHYSRLLIDPNRGTDDPTLIMRIADGSVVPGNRHISDEERAKRIRDYYEPYHAAIDATLDQCITAGRVPILFSIHSFTESWRGRPRPWHAAVLWDQDGRFAQPLIKALRDEGDLIVGENEPYSGRLKGDTMWRHGTMRGIAHCILEIRQDLIKDETGQAEWAQRLERILTSMFDCEMFSKSIGHLEYHISNDDIQSDACEPAVVLQKEKA